MALRRCRGLQWSASSDNDDGSLIRIDRARAAEETAVNFAKELERSRVQGNQLVAYTRALSGPREQWGVSGEVCLAF
jgi:hypothetical protein